MVLAILDGRKTQTRGVAKLTGAGLLRLKAPYAARLVDGVGPVWSPAAGDQERPLPPDRLTGPCGKPGDALWVREAFRFPRGDDASIPKIEDCSPRRIAELCREAEWNRPWCPTKYEADNHATLGYASEGWGPWGRLRPSIYMPKWACRLRLRVTDVRVERVQDISEKDALAEGVIPDYAVACIKQGHPYTAVPLFQIFWDSINANRKDSDGNLLPYSWADDPWVWCVSFEVMR